MESPKIRGSRRGPEEPIVQAIIRMLKLKDWFVVRTHGNMYQAGLPDLYATHTLYRGRWIEVKDPNRKGDVFTPAQHEMFPKLTAYGSPVYVLTGATMDEYEKLFREANWAQYLQFVRIRT